MTNAMKNKMLPTFHEDKLFFVDDVALCGEHMDDVKGKKVIGVEEDCALHGDDGVFRCDTCGKFDGGSR